MDGKGDAGIAEAFALRSDRKGRYPVMKKAACVFLAVVFSFVGSTSMLRGQQVTSIVGTVVDTQGKPVAGVKIVAQDTSGKVVGETVADAEGRYKLEKLPAGQYNLTLDPITTSFLGETVVVSLVEEGLTVNWIVSSGTNAVAFASSGIASGGIFGMGPGATGLLGFLFLGGSILGLGAAVGAFSGAATSSQ